MNRAQHLKGLRAHRSLACALVILALPKPATAAEAGPPRSALRAGGTDPVAAPFRLTGVDIDGSSLAPTALSATWAPLVGQMVDTAVLERLSDALVATYERSDIALYTVLVPSQDFAAGVVRIKVLEGRIDEVSIDGPGGARNRALIQRYLAKLQAERPLSRRGLQRYATLIRDIPGAGATLQFLGGGAEGAMRLAVKTDPEPVQAAVSFNNRGTAFLGRTQLTGDLYLNSLFRQGDQTRLTVAVPAAVDRFQYLAVSQSQPVGADGMSVQVNAGYLRTRPKGMRVAGKAASIGVSVSRPILRDYHNRADLTLGADGLNSDSAFLGRRYSDDQTRAARLAASYERDTGRRRLELSATASLGFAGLGARTITPGLSDLTFQKWVGRAAFTTRLGAKVVLRLNAMGQWSDDRLPVSEQFALGGAEFGRAYAAATVAGDHGYAGAVELAFQPQNLPAFVRGAEAYGFIDAGKAVYRARGGVEAQSAQLRSTGAGVRIPLKGRVVLQFEAARALPSGTAALGRGAWRGVFAIRTLF